MMTKKLTLRRGKTTSVPSEEESPTLGEKTLFQMPACGLVQDSLHNRQSTSK